MYPIKQSTAITIPFFVHDASGDAVTGLADGTFTKRISKNGAAFGAMTVTISEMENGWYSIPLSTSHSDTLGILSVTFTNAGAKQVNLQWRVETRILDDLAFPTTTGRSIDVTATGAVGIDWGNVENPTTAVDLSATDIQLCDTITTYTGNTVQTGDAFAEIGTAGAGLTDLGGMSAGMKTEIADTVWDEPLTGAAHNAATSAGRRLRQLHGSITIASDTAQAGTDNSITLAAGESATNDIFTLNYISIVSGTGVGQTRIIVDYNGSTKVARVHRNWLTNPASDSEYVITANANIHILDIGTLQAAGASTATLRAGASATAGSYVGGVISIVTNTGREQVRAITAYNQSTKVATVDRAWTTQPDSTSDYTIVAGTGGGVTLADGVAHGGTPGSSTATLAMKRFYAKNPDGAAMLIETTDSGSTSLSIGHTSGFMGCDIIGGANSANANALRILGGVDGGSALYVQGYKHGIEISADFKGVTITGADGGVEVIGDGGHGVDIKSIWGDDKHGVLITGGVSGACDGVRIIAGTGGHGIFAQGDTDGDGFHGEGQGTGVGFLSTPDATGFGLLATDTITLPGQEAPPLTPTFSEAVGWMFKIVRNRKTQTSTVWSLYADDETTVDAKATVSDDGITAIKQEIVTGP